MTLVSCAEHRRIRGNTIDNCDGATYFERDRFSRIAIHPRGGTAHVHGGIIMVSARRLLSALCLVHIFSSSFALAQPTAADRAAVSSATTSTPGAAWEGEVTGTNVRVRSGPGTGWYATTKLNTGDRVVVVKEERGWYHVVPPPGSFSYVDMEDVDRQSGGRTGIVKRDGVSIRAGSEMAASKSTTQLWVKKGQIVEIIGEVDGFFKITPPTGALLYISRDFVKPVAANQRTGIAERHAAALSPEPQPRPAVTSPAAATATPVSTTPRPAQPVPARTAMDESDIAVDSIDRSTMPDEYGDVEPAFDDEGNMEGADPMLDATGRPIDDGAPLETDRSIQSLKNRDAAAGATPTSRDIPPGQMQKTSGRYQALLTAIEGDLSATMQLPLEQRDLDSLVSRYEEVAVQTDERVPSEYAKIRVTQLKTMIDLRKARADSASKSADLDAFKARMTTERMQIMRARAEKETERFDFVGELRKSYAFAPEKRRYRLVDPNRQTTIAYIDIPRDVTENVEYMIGRTVGVRTSGQRYSQAARIPIAVAASLTDLTPSTRPATVGPMDTGSNSGAEVMPPPLEEPVRRPSGGSNNTDDEGDAAS